MLQIIVISTKIYPSRWQLKSLINLLLWSLMQFLRVAGYDSGISLRTLSKPITFPCWKTKRLMNPWIKKATFWTGVHSYTHPPLPYTVKHGLFQWLKEALVRMVKDIIKDRKISFHQVYGSHMTLLRACKSFPRIELHYIFATKRS